MTDDEPLGTHSVAVVLAASPGGGRGIPFGEPTATSLGAYGAGSGETAYLADDTAADTTATQSRR